ncbi:MAG: HAD hydrolase family protein, partial [Candidatus Thermoplasmatota archaeon]|nr:HAD hydrolase family protein [Candidatus Thermoplasmatota archaeon]
LLCDKKGEVLGEGKLQVALRDKRTTLLDIINKQGVSKEHTVAVGNSYIDAQMLDIAGLGIAFNPADDVVVRAADVVIKEKNLLRILDFLDL